MLLFGRDGPFGRDGLGCVNRQVKTPCVCRGLSEFESLRDGVLTGPSASARYASLRMPSVGMTLGGGRAAMGGGYPPVEPRGYISGCRPSACVLSLLRCGQW